MKYRICYCCGSDKTYIDKRGYMLWNINHDYDDNVLCQKCNNRLNIAYKWSELFHIKFNKI